MFTTEKTEEQEIEYQKQVKKMTAEALAKSHDEPAEELPYQDLQLMKKQVL